MAKVMECPQCDGVMECVNWYTDTGTVGGKQGTGDFDCRNCNHQVNTERESVARVDGYKSEVFEDVPTDTSFEEFIEQYTDQTLA